MKIKFIGCEVFKNEFMHLGIDKIADCEFFKIALDEEPEKLHETLQEAILENQDYDRIVLGYCRCSAALLGLYSPHTELLFPTVHDCVGIFLGSTRTHLDYIYSNPGTLYITQGFIDYGLKIYEEAQSYFTTYGEKKAKKLIKAFYGGYNRGLFIKTVGIKDDAAYEEYLKKAQEIADFFKWNLDTMEGSSVLMEALVKGEPREEVVLLEKGQQITADCFLEFPLNYKR